MKPTRQQDWPQLRNGCSWKGRGHMDFFPFGWEDLAIYGPKWIHLGEMIQPYPLFPKSWALLCCCVLLTVCSWEGVIYPSPQWLQASVSQAKLPHLRRLVLNQITVCSSGSRVGTYVSELNWGLLPLSASSVQSGDVLSRFYPVPSLLHLHIRLSMWSQPVSVIQCPATSSTSYPRVLAVVQGSLLLGSSSRGMEYDVRSIWERIR